GPPLPRQRSERRHDVVDLAVLQPMLRNGGHFRSVGHAGARQHDAVQIPERVDEVAHELAPLRIAREQTTDERTEWMVANRGEPEDERDVGLALDGAFQSSDEA